MPITAAIVGSALSITISTKKLYDDLIKPIFTSSKIKRERSDKLSKRLNDYVNLCLKRYRSLNTIAHPEKKLDLLQIYIPLTLRGADEKERFRIDNFDLKFLNKNGPKIIIDYAGMGKSTLFKYFYLSCIKNDYRIPLLIELRKVKKNQSIEEFLSKEISNKSVIFSIEEINDLLLSGKCVLLLDGLDEVDNTLLPDIVDNIMKLIEEDSDNKIILSSRKMDILKEMDGFERFEIAPLTKEESIALLRRYGLGKADYMDDLVKEVNARYFEIAHLLKNPLTTSLLFKSYQHKNYIPLKKSLFYKQVYDALYESHDFSKEVAYSRQRGSNLNYDDFFKLCSILGYLTYKDKMVEFSKEEITRYITPFRA